MNSWTIGPTMKQPHQGMGAAMAGNLAFFNVQMCVAGGIGEGGDVAESGDVEALPIYFASPKEWAAVEPLNTSRYGHVVALGNNGQVYAIGGRLASTSGPLLAVGNVEGYTPGYVVLEGSPPGPIQRVNEGNVWATAKNSMPTPRERAAAATGSNGLIYVAGGSNGSTRLISSPLKTLEAYDASKDAWTPLKDMLTARDGPAAAPGTDGRIYVMGGMDTSGSYLNTVEAYDPATNSWEKVTNMKTARQGLAAVLATDGQIYAIGGGNPGPLQVVEVYNFTTGWSTAPSLNFAREFPAAAAAPNGVIYAIGGQTGGALVLNTTETLSV
jgi:N-acetylneuraminic acid mutarotase